MINKSVFGSGKHCFCDRPDLIENYDKAIADKSQTWHCHHRMELVVTGAVVDSSIQDLKDWGLYYNRPADELIFLTPAEHEALHHTGKAYMKGRKLSDEHRAAISKGMKGKGTWIKGHTPWNKGISIGKKPEHAEKMKLKKWFNNGEISVMRETCPEGFVAGRIYIRKERIQSR